MLSEATRHIGNLHSILDEPSPEQAEEIDAGLVELVNRIESDPLKPNPFSPIRGGEHF